MTLLPSPPRDLQGRIQVWSTNDTGSGIAHLLQDAANVDGWSGWTSEPGVTPISDASLVANADGHLEVFVADGTNDELMHMFRSPGQDTWSTWLSLGDANGNDVESTPAPDAGPCVFRSLSSPGPCSSRHVWPGRRGPRRRTRTPLRAGC